MTPLLVISSERYALNDLTRVTHNEGKGVTLSLLNRQGDVEVLTVFEHLQFPLWSPFFEFVLTNYTTTPLHHYTEKAG